MKRILLCAALLVVFAPGLLGQEAEFKRDLARAKEIAAQFAPKDEFETTAAYEARLRQAEAFRPALDAIQAKEYILDVDITVGTYNADRQTFPVTASRKDYLEPVSSTLSVPLSIARTMKSRLKSAKGRFRIWRGMPQVRALWVEVGGKALAIPVEWVPGPVLRYEEDRRVTALAFNADGSLLASGGGGDSRLEEKSHVNLWDMRTFTRIAMLEHPDKARFPWWIPMVAFNADSTVLAATFWDERAVVRWDLPSLSVLPVLQHANRVNGVGFNEDDNEIVVVDEGLIFVWDALKNELKRQYRHHPSAIGGRSRIAPDGKHVLLIKSDGVTENWDVVSGEKAQVEPNARVVGGGFSPNRDELMLLCDTGRAVFYNVKDDVKQQTGSLPLPTPLPSDLTVCVPNSDLIVSYAGEIVSFRRSNMTDAVRITMHRVNAIAVNPDGTMLALGTDGGEIHLWYRQTTAK